MLLKSRVRPFRSKQPSDLQCMAFSDYMGGDVLQVDALPSQDVLCGVGLKLTETYPPRAVEILPNGMH